MEKAHGFNMGFCLECRRDPAPQLRPKEQMFNTRLAPNQGNTITRRTDGEISYRQSQPDGLLDMPPLTRQWRGLADRTRDPRFLDRVAREFPSWLVPWTHHTIGGEFCALWVPFWH
jgi:hypothetical protein